MLFEKQKNTENEKIAADYYLIEQIQPQGGITFNDERYIQTGNSYECCLHIYELPEKVNDNWLKELTDIKDTVVTIDISSHDIYEIKKNINRSIQEQASRRGSATNWEEAYNAEKKANDMIQLFHEISKLKEVVKIIDIRIFISDREKEKLEEKISKLSKILESNKYRSAIFLNEAKNEWVSMYQTYTEQQKNPYSIFGQSIQGETLAHGNPSVIHQAVSHLKEQGYDMHGKTCMVIGNGEMGKVAAQTLRDAGANVTVTVRQYRSGLVSIPIGCSRIHYGERMRFLPNCDVVVSATASPNFTLRDELFQDVVLEKPLLLLDLAVPRDVDPSLGSRDGITLYDMDSFRTERLSPEAHESLIKAASIVEEQMAEFFQWLDGRDVIPRIQEIRAEAVQDLNLRIEKILKKTPMQEEDRANLLEAVDTAAGKVVNKMIFGLRDSLNQEAFLECVAGLEKVYED